MKYIKNIRPFVIFAVGVLMLIKAYMLHGG